MKNLVCIRPGRFEYEFERWLKPVNNVIKAMVEMN